MVQFLLAVNVDMVRPVRARVGDVVGVRPGHPERPVVVLRAEPDGTWVPAELGPPNYGALLEHLENGTLTQTYPRYLSLRHVAVGQTA